MTIKSAAWCRRLDKPANGKNVTSRDPRKAKVVAAFKAATRGTRVTLLKELPNGRFQARCLRPMQEWDGEGYYEIDLNVKVEELAPAKTAVTFSVDVERIRGLLCCAFEGGSNYWYEIVKAHYPEGRTAADYKEGGAGQDGKNYWHWSQLVPTHEGGALRIASKMRDEINGKKAWRLDREALKRGLDVMAKKYPQHFAAFIEERDDADTGDVFLQCCLFGELVFG